MNRSPLPALLSLLLAAVLLPGPAPAAAQEAVVIKGGTIVPVSGPAIPGGSLVLEKGRIAAIGKTVKAPAGARVIDATGLYVYPGLVAPMAALGLTGYPGAGSDINEVGASTPYLDPFEALNPEDETIAVARVDGVTSCLTPAGTARLINGSLMAIHLDGGLAEQMVLQRGVGLVFNTSAREANAYPSTLEGVSRFFTDKLDKARQYTEKKKGGEKAVDPEMEALAAVLDGGRRVVFAARDEVPIRIALRLMADYKIKGILWTASNDILKYADEIAARGIPVIWSGTTDLPERWQAVDLNYHTAAVLAVKKILFAFTDSTGLGASNVRRLPVPAALSVAYGLSEEEALKAITLHPARIFGLDDRIGSLDVGKSADVVVCSQPILRASSRIKHVFIAGREIPRDNVQTRLRDKYRPLVEERLARAKAGTKR
jgi:imidazolonepropionase-like amidohydrolase